MKCLDRFNKKMNYSGGSLRDENIKNSRELLSATFSDDASSDNEVYYWELGDYGTDYQGKEKIEIRLYQRSFSSANGVVIHFQTLIENPIIVGDILYNKKTNEYFICRESFNINNIHWEGKLTLCNWILKWQNSKGDILEYPSYIINATQYNSGEQTYKQFTINSSQHIVLLPYDENTSILQTPQRFFLSKNPLYPQTFIITQNDQVTYAYGEKGIISLTLVSYETNKKTDRIDLGICDYFDVDTNVNTNIENKDEEQNIRADIQYKTNIIKSGGSKKQFIGKFYNDNNEVLDILPVWEIVCDFKNELEIKQSNDSIYIGIDNDDYIDEEFKLILSDGKDHSTSIVIKIDSIL